MKILRKKRRRTPRNEAAEGQINFMDVLKTLRGVFKRASHREYVFIKLCFQTNKKLLDKRSKSFAHIKYGDSLLRMRRSSNLKRIFIGQQFRAYNSHGNFIVSVEIA